MSGKQGAGRRSNTVLAAVVATVLASLAGMSGCGQKGPLYIPEPVVETPGPGDMKEAEDEETSQSG